MVLNLLFARLRYEVPIANFISADLSTVGISHNSKFKTISTVSNMSVSVTNDNSKILNNTAVNEINLLGHRKALNGAKLANGQTAPKCY